MKYIIILLVLSGFFATPSFAVPNDDPLDFAEFVGVNDTYALGEEFEIRFEKMTVQPCLSYQISLMKDGLPESKITFSREPLCATTEPVEPYLFSDEFSKPEFFDAVGTYHVELEIDGTTLLKKIEIIDQTFSITQKQVRYVIPYEITGGFIEDMNLDCSSASLVLWVSSYDSGTVHLDIPNSMLGGIFMVLVNDKEYENVSLDGNKLAINFTKDVDKIEIKGTYSLNSDITGVCDVIHNPPYSYVLSPLQQFKSGVPFSEIKCNGNLQITQRYDNSPACVKSETVFELIKRGWVSDIIVAVQSRDVFLEQDATSSYMEKVIPTLDDFKQTLSESHDINTIFSKFGEPHKDIGSGIHIYVYELNDDTEVWIGYADDIWYVKHVDHDGNFLEELTQNENTLRPDDRLEVKHSAGYTTVFITLSSWDEYYEWEKQRGSEHDAMPPIPVDENSINPIVFDLLIEMWKFEDYEVSKYNKNLFVKTIQKDYGVSNHHGIHDWLEKEYDKAFGKSNDGFSSYFEFEDRVYHVTMLAVD